MSPPADGEPAMSALLGEVMSTGPELVMSTGAHVPPTHVPTEHCVPSETGACAGQLSEAPVQVDACMHSVAGAHTVPADFGTSAGQAGLIPSQASLTSHAPLAARHTVLTATKLQVAEQHEPTVPFAAPLSHCSEPCTTPSPHTTAKHAG
jgi:hypothetical protein